MSLHNTLKAFESGAYLPNFNAALIQALWVRDAPIRVHGNGFIQIDVPGHEGLRVHVWGHPDIPRQVNPTPMHNHRFGFESRVLEGCMVNTELTFAETVLDDSAGTHIAYECVPRDDEDTELVPAKNKRPFLLMDAKSTVIHRGSTYETKPVEFHETIPQGPTITLMQKKGLTDVAPPLVMVPVGLKPSNEFDRYEAMDTDRAWGIALEMVDLR